VLAIWAADPEAIIRQRFKQLSRAIQASTDAAPGATTQHELVGASGS
jgi:hypothetical protein